MEQKKLHKLLIVDDDDDILTIARISMKSIADLKVICANSGEKAIKIALEEQPDLILLDIMMPMMDGVATLKALRLIPTTANIPVVFFTARQMIDVLTNHKALGAIDVIIKPFDPLELPNIVRNIWDKHTNSHSDDI